jgi:DNA-binding SARP family transcriptional activator/tetratricopeptide (TPR) repeat protein
MRFGILGPLSVDDDGRELAITAGRDRVLLAMLLVRAGRIVAVDDLVDALWDNDPPVTARGQLQNCVSRLRRLLPADTIITDPAGYGIRVEPDDLDATRFAALTAAGRDRVADQPDQARRLLRQALDLWRGPALAGIDSRAVRRRAAVLDEQQAVATEDWVDLELAGGRDRDLIAGLAGLVDRFPLRERLRAQLMLSLYRAGRQADALAEYRRARTVLKEELGIEPGPALSDLHRRILAGEVGGPAPGVRQPATGPRSLPRTVGDFTGRGESVHRLIEEIDDDPGDAPIIRIIDGMAGSGKTTLALHLANTVADRYPDAQLFVDLHGHSDRQPVEPAAALTVLLRQLGVDPDRIPADVDGRVAMWRSELADRRVLVVLDNAAGTAQVSPLLPTAPGCLALVTSRRRLAGLDGARPESIPLLTEAEGVELLARIAADRVAAEPQAAAEVVRRCGGLPLAIRLAGSRLAHRQRWRVADLVRRLGSAALPELTAEDRTVGSAFALSYSQLAGSQQARFRLLGVHPGERFDAPAVAALADLPLDDAEDLLDDLVDMHLVEEPEPGLFRLHDLMREYAATLAAGDPDEIRHAAVVRLADLHLHVAARASDEVRVSRGTAAGHLPGPLRPDLLDAVADPVAWLDRERAVLPKLADAAVAAGRPDYAWRLPLAAWRFFDIRGYIDDILQAHRRGEAAARAAGDRPALAETLTRLASAYARRADFAEALGRLREAASLYQAVADRPAEAAAWDEVSVLAERMGALRQAVDAGRRALRLHRRLRDDQAVLRRSVALAVPHLRLGQDLAAQRLLRTALLLAVEIRDDMAVVVCLTRLGRARIGLGQFGPAERLLTAALGLSGRLRFAIGRAEALAGLGRLAYARGHGTHAVRWHEEALAACTDIGDRRARTAALNDLGEALGATGRRRTAAARFREVLAGEADPYETARAEEGLAAATVDDDPVSARCRWQRALTAYVRMEVPRSGEIRRRLADLRDRPA